MQDLQSMVKDIIDVKAEMYELQEKLGRMEKELIQELINKAPEMLSIKWNKLYSAVQAQPLRQHLAIINRHR